MALVLLLLGTAASAQKLQGEFHHRIINATLDAAYL